MARTRDIDIADDRLIPDDDAGWSLRDALLLAAGVAAGVCIGWYLADAPGDDAAADAADAADGDEELEERVLEAFANDPVLSTRAVEIGSAGAGVITLAGWVYDEAETTYAATIARGVPGVTTVINHLTTRADEQDEMVDDLGLDPRDREAPAAE